MTSMNKKQTEAPTSSKAKVASKQAPARTSRRKRTQKPPVPPTPPPKARKRDQMSALLLRNEGATIEQMATGLGWLPHTVRAALTGLKKLGYAIDSDKIDGLRTYRAVVPK